MMFRVEMLSISNWRFIAYFLCQSEKSWQKDFSKLNYLLRNQFAMVRIIAKRNYVGEHLFFSNFELRGRRISY